MIDSHCHLDFHDFDRDRDEVFQRASEAGVGKIINPGSDFASCQRAVDLAERYSEVFAAVGIHPHDAQQITKESLAELRVMLNNPKTVAIGEIGLDYFKMHNEKTLQKEAFIRQLELAKEFDKPLIIHAREANADILEILDKYSFRGVFHCFGSDWNFAQQVLARGFLIGITGIVTYPNAKNIQEVARNVPLEKLLIETDAPFLAPQKYRGQRNEPAFVTEVAQKIAELKGVPIAKIVAATTRNAENLFSMNNDK